MYPSRYTAYDMREFTIQRYFYEFILKFIVTMYEEFSVEYSYCTRAFSGGTDVSA